MPYLLNSNTPVEGENLKEHIIKKYGPEAGASFGKPGTPMELAGRKVGVVFNNERRVVRTMKCHQLMEYSKEVEPDVSAQLMDVLFRRYLIEGQDVSQVDILVDAAVECGLTEEGARNAVVADKYCTEVMQQVDYARRVLRVSGVPFVSIESPKSSGKSVSFSGAQSASVISEQLLDIIEDAQN
jgi:predicted DsbA family dithiol-disulfide isomerase